MDSTTQQPVVESPVAEQDEESRKSMEVDSDDAISITDSASENESDGFSHKERLEKSAELKTAGNDAFKKSDDDAAISHYKQGLKHLRPLRSKCPPDEIEHEHHEEYKQLCLSLHLNSAAVEIRRKEFSSAIEHSTEALKLDDKNIRAYYRRGVARKQSGELDRAKADLLAILELDSKNKDAIRELNAIKRKIQEFKQQEKKTFADAFKKVSVGGLYADVEREKKLAEERKKKEKQRLFKEYQTEMKQFEDDGKVEDAKMTFEEWKKKKEEKRKEEKRLEAEKREKEREEKRKAEAAARAARGETESEQVDLDEEDKAAVLEAKKKGYCYFRRELPEHEKELIGNITPSKVNSDNNATKLAADSGSAWNNGTTWEEKDVTSQAKDALRDYISSDCDFHEFGSGVRIAVSKVSNVTGDAQQVVSSGKLRKIFDMSVKVSWKAEVQGDSDEIEKASGSLKFPEVSSMLPVNEYECELSYSKKPTSTIAQDALHKAMGMFQPFVRGKIGDFVDNFVAK